MSRVIQKVIIYKSRKLIGHTWMTFPPSLCIAAEKLDAVRVLTS